MSKNVLQMRLKPGLMDVAGRPPGVYAGLHNVSGPAVRKHPGPDIRRLRPDASSAYRHARQGSVMMRVTLKCDYCGREIRRKDPHMTVKTSGEMPDLIYEDQSRFRVEELGHYHSGPRDDIEGYSCFASVIGVVRGLRGSGVNLESIETASHQYVAAQRRKHRKGAKNVR